MQPDDLLGLKDDMIAFIAGNGLRRFHAYVPDDVPTVLFEEENPDGWKDFVEHAKAAGALLVTMSEVTLEKSDLEQLMDGIRVRNFPDEQWPELEEAQQLIQHVGKIGYLQLGFAHQGVLFLYETATAWYDLYQGCVEALTGLGGLLADDTDDD